ncbi:MAG: hypothetical protein JWQ70_2204 [Aeromicrobium sp.]|nr:hypothetical protein [Aeromicrobium sp.]
MDADDGEVLAAEGKTNLRGLVLELRRIVYRCELLQEDDLTDGTRQALWCGVVTTYCGLVSASDIHSLGPVHAQTHELLQREQVRHAVGDSTVVPDGICDLDLEAGTLCKPYVDPPAARALVEALIGRLEV